MVAIRVTRFSEGIGVGQTIQIANVHLDPLRTWAARDLIRLPWQAFRQGSVHRNELRQLEAELRTAETGPPSRRPTSCGRGVNRPLASPFLSTHLRPPFKHALAHPLPPRLPIVHVLGSDPEGARHGRSRDALLEALTAEDRSGLW